MLLSREGTFLTEIARLLGAICQFVVEGPHWNQAHLESTEFDRLVTSDKWEEEDNFADHVNPTTLTTTQGVGDAGLTTLQEHGIMQLERHGFFRFDRPHRDGKPLVLHMIPDGKTKSMSGMPGKLAHHCSTTLSRGTCTTVAKEIVKGMTHGSSQMILLRIFCLLLCW